MTRPASDDLTFTWDWGDGTTATVSTHLNGGAFPFTATDTQSHVYALAGTYDLNVRMADDDGGVMEIMLVIIIV